MEHPGFERGTKITIHLKPNCLQFASKEDITKVIQRYSNFINYPIFINGEPTNLVKAIWAKSKRDLSEEEYVKFWEHFSKQKVAYKYKLHYAADVPLELKALLYIPSMHMEKYGM
jgi:HSP90 family molecular chaperone